MLTHCKHYQDIFIELSREWDLSSELWTDLSILHAISMLPRNLLLKSMNIYSLPRRVRLKYIYFHLAKIALWSYFQAAIWQRCLEQNPSIPSPEGRGWKIEIEGSHTQLMVHWMTGQPAPEAILDLLACNCAKNCELPQCIGITKGFKCTKIRVTDCSIRVSRSALLGPGPPLDIIIIV